jgi:hypothetical protein
MSILIEQTSGVGLSRLKSKSGDMTNRCKVILAEETNYEAGDRETGS